MSRVEDGWARFELWEVCGAVHHWHVYEDGMPCMCGARWLITLGDGTLWPMPVPDSMAPNVAYRFGVMSHFIDGECDCHPPRIGCADRTTRET